MGKGVSIVSTPGSRASADVREVERRNCPDLAPARPAGRFFASPAPNSGSPAARPSFKLQRPGTSDRFSQLSNR